MTKKEFCPFVKWLRDKGFKTRDVSRLTGINYATLGAAFNGYRAMSDEKWARVAEAVGVKVGEMPIPSLVWQETEPSTTVNG